MSPSALSFVRTPFFSCPTRKYLVEVGMIACVVLEVGVPQLVAWPDHQRGTELEGTPARLPLAMARSEGPESG